MTAEAKNAIGKVGKETEPVLHMLKKIGFQYKNHVDPFDGGPHLWANVEDLLPMKKIRSLTLGEERSPEDASIHVESGLLCRKSQRAGEFKAVAVRGWVAQDRFHWVDPKAIELKAALGLTAGDSVIFMPYY